MRRAPSLLAAAAAACLLAACSSSLPKTDTSPHPSSPSPTPSSQPPASTSPAPSMVPSVGPSEFTNPAGTESSPKFGNTSGGSTKLTGANGLVDGRKRVVVVELSGTNQPEYRAQYVEKPLAQGSGEPLSDERLNFLRVELRGFAMPEPGDSPLPKPLQFEPGIPRVFFDGWFEGQYVMYLGLTDKPGFAVRLSPDNSKLYLILGS